MQGLYRQFKTDTSLETEGIVLDIVDGDNTTTFLLARAGGANKAFGVELQSLMRPHQRAVERGTMDTDVAAANTVKAMARHIIKGWDNVTDQDGEVMEFNEENCIKLLTDLPDLTEYILQYANKAANFLEVERVEDAKS